MKTYSAKKAEVVRQWHIVDAADKTLGRISTEIAKLLCGKNKVMFTPHIDTGDFVIVVNAEKVKVTGNKEKQKEYFRLASVQIDWLVMDIKVELIRKHMIRNYT